MNLPEDPSPDRIPDDVWVLLPVHDRRDTTIGCLDELRETQPYDALDVVVIDDGSTDGTSEAIQREHPAVHLLHGDGSLWWGGSVRKGMEYALDRGAEVLVWLNDDVRPDPGAVVTLSLAVHRSPDTVLSGRVRPTAEPDHLVTIDGRQYGYTTRWRHTGFGIVPLEYDDDTDLQPADALSGKFVAVHRRVVRRIGLPDADRFPQNDCDFEYTIRAGENGFDLAVYTRATARDTDVEPYHDRLSPAVSLKTAVEDAFVHGRHTGNSIVDQYRRDRRFVSGPLPVVLSVSAYNAAKIVAALGKKAALAVLLREHRLY